MFSVSCQSSTFTQIGARHLAEPCIFYSAHFDLNIEFIWVFLSYWVRVKPVNRCVILLRDFHANISGVTYPTLFCNWFDEQQVVNFRMLPTFQARGLFRVPGAAAGRGLPAQTSWPVTRGPTRARRISFARSATRGSWDPTTLGK